ncbi:MAG TPA: helix-turn-helix domain-containing protein [Burkholderiales bacterium]|nr:helix-turn-helix domain-containing protein [Burkholderiales bacterium]
MMQEKNCCPAEITLKVIGGKWKLVILWHLRDEVKRFSELKRNIPGITQRMLTQQLRELEKDGVISRKIYPQVPPRVEYSINKFGTSLQPILRSMCQWGIKYKKRVEALEQHGITQQRGLRGLHHPEQALF